MKGVLSMTRNEIFKTRKQTGIFVVLIILAVLIAVIPAGTAAINALFSYSGYDIEQEMLWYQNWMEQNPEEFLYYQPQYEAYKFFYDNDIDATDWRFGQLFYEYEDALEMRILLSYFKDNPTYPAMIENANGDKVRLWFDEQRLLPYADPEVLAEYFELPDEIEDDFKEDVYIEDGVYIGIPDNYYSYYYVKTGVDYDAAMRAAIASIDFDTALADIEKHVSEFQTLILANDTLPLHEANLADMRTQLEACVAQREQYRLLLADKPEDKETLSMLEQTEREIASLKEMIPFYEFAYEHNIMLSETDWRYNAVQNAVTLINRKANHTIVSEEEYETSYLSRQNMSYSAYVKNQNKKLSLLNEGIELLRYGLEHDVPPTGTVTISTKNTWQSALSSSMFMLTVFGVLLGGTILSNEFSAGTIRLLLIRPRRRYKILLSKLLCLFTYLIGLLLFAYVVQFIVSLIVTLGTDAFTPELWVIGGTIVKVPAALAVLAKAFLDLLPVLFYSCLALMCSAIITRAVFALAIPLLLYIAASLSSTIMSLGFQTTIYNYTILAHGSLSQYLGNPFLSNDFADMLFGNGAAPQLSLSVAAIIVGVHIVGALIVSFIVFCKKQIKN